MLRVRFNPPPPLLVQELLLLPGLHISNTLGRPPTIFSGCFGAAPRPLTPASGGKPQRGLASRPYSRRASCRTIGPATHLRSCAATPRQGAQMKAARRNPCGLFRLNGASEFKRLGVDG